MTKKLKKTMFKAQRVKDKLFTNECTFVIKLQIQTFNWTQCYNYKYKMTFKNQKTILQTLAPSKTYITYTQTHKTKYTYTLTH